MQTHAIIEIEEGSLNVVVGGRDGKVVRVHRSVRLPLAELGKDALATALRGIGSDVLLGATGVHVVLGDRRAQHFSSTLPAMKAAAAVQFVVREALRVTNLPAAADVLLATRLLRRLPGGKLLLGSTALPRTAWEPLAQAFAAANLEVLGLHSMETCLALGATAGGAGTVAVVEVNSGRARFVLCDGESPAQVRRFLIGGGGEGNGAALTTQLAMELPRTFEWLRETAQPVPATLVLGLRVGVDDGAAEMLLSEDLKRVVRAVSPVTVAATQAAPGLATSMLLARLAAGQPLPSLLQPPRIELPMGSGRILSLLATAAAGIACTMSAVVDGTELLRLRDEVQATVAEREALAATIVAAPAAADPAPAGDEHLQAALAMRRPISRLLADVSNCAAAELHLEDLKFASTERVLVSGVVQGANRQQALAAISAFAKRLGEIPYVQTGGDEEITEVPRLANCFRFRLGMTWRNP